jgi:YARHG domain
MKRLLSFFVIISIALYSCNNTKKEKTETKENNNAEIINPDSTLNPVLATSLEILGSYVGSFGTNKITLLITKATSDSIVGRSIVGGNDRPFAGSILKNGDKYIINAKEPGDDKDDGVFNFSIDTKKANILDGSWKPNKVSETVKEKEFSLERKAYKYIKDAGAYPQASERLLKVAEVENEMKEDLEFMRNEIFARHGYCFQKKNLRQQFEMQDWYVPNTIDIKNRLTDIEKKNIALIKKYERYAEEYGDDFGR